MYVTTMLAVYVIKLVTGEYSRALFCLYDLLEGEGTHGTLPYLGEILNT